MIYDSTCILNYLTKKSNTNRDTFGIYDQNYLGSPMIWFGDVINRFKFSWIP